MKKKIHVTQALLLATVLLLGGCSAAGKTSAASQVMAVNSDTAEAGGWAEEAGKEMSMETAAVTEAAMDDAAPAEGGSSQASNDLSARKLIKTVSLSMETKEFDTMKTRLEESVTSFGGYIENSSFDAPQGTYHYRYYSLTVRIPSESLDAFVANAGELGTLTNKSENVEDVTLDYVDKTAYKESLQVEYDRVTELLEKARDLEQVLALESKLSQLRYEINSYESQIRTYDNLIDYSTVHIYISEVEYEKEVSDTVGSRISNGFRSSLYSVRDFFVNLFVGLVSNLPVLLMLAAVVLVIAAVIRKSIKRSKAKQAQQKNTEMYSCYQEKVKNTPQNSVENTAGEENPEKSIVKNQKNKS